MYTKEIKNMRRGISRRDLILGASAAGVGMAVGGLSLAAPAIVKGQTMTVSLWGGPFAKAIREALVPGFEKDHGVKVAIEEGLSADSLAKVRMERDRPRRTVVGVDDIYIPLLRTEDLVTPITESDVPNLRDVNPSFLIEDGYGVGAAVNYATLYYNTARVTEPIDSYAAIWDPQYKGRVSLSSAHSSFGIMVLMAATAIVNNQSIEQAQHNLDAGFELIKKIRPDLYSIVDSSIALAPLLAKGEIFMTFINSRFMTPYILRGAPLKRAETREGAFMLLNAASLVKGAPLQDQGKDFLNRMLSPEVQTAMSVEGYTGPVNSTVEVPDELKPHVPHGEETISRMVKIDLQNFSQNWAAWQARWNKEVAS